MSKKEVIKLEEPNLNLVCEKCGHWVRGMSMKILDTGKIDHTMLCHRCDADKFDTIYIHEVINHGGPVDDETGEPLMPPTQMWRVYKFEGKIRWMNVI